MKITPIHTRHSTLPLTVVYFGVMAVVEDRNLLSYPTFRYIWIGP